MTNAVYTLFYTLGEDMTIKSTTSLSVAQSVTQSIAHLWRKSLSRQLMLSVALVYTLLMSAFIFFQQDQQKTFLHQQSHTLATGLAQTLASHSPSWIASNNFTPMQLVTDNTPTLHYATIVDLNNSLLSNNSAQQNSNQSTRYASIPFNKTLLGNSINIQVLLDNDQRIDVIAPIFTQSRQIGWARVGIDRTPTMDELATLTQYGLLSIFLSIFLGSLCVCLIADRLTRAIRQMTAAVHAVALGQRGVQFKLQRMDELGALSHDFDDIMKALEENELALKDYQEHLEQLVADRTHELSEANEELVNFNLRIQTKKDKLEKAYEQLQQLQDQLIESEKFSALGALVAGVSHEINTPLGVSYTGVSCLHDILIDLKENLQTNNLSRASLTDFLERSDATIVLVIKNMQRATHLLNSFKQIAVAQTTHNLVDFSLNDYVNNTLFDLSNKIKAKEIEVTCDIKDKILITGDPGLFSQLLNNLVINSIIHAFDDTTNNLIEIAAHQTEQGHLFITYRDNGSGMDSQQLKKLYDPFYTTKMSTGGGGLGMHVVYNIITQRLKGKIKCESEPDKGVFYQIDIPLPVAQPNETTAVAASVE